MGEEDPFHRHAEVARRQMAIDRPLSTLSCRFTRDGRVDPGRGEVARRQMAIDRHLSTFSCRFTRDGRVDPGRGEVARRLEGLEALVTGWQLGHCLLPNCHLGNALLGSSPAASPRSSPVPHRPARSTGPSQDSSSLRGTRPGRSPDRTVRRTRGCKGRSEGRRRRSARP